MEQKNSQTHKFEISNFKDVYDYCYANGILDINSFVEKCFKQGFDIKKYGLLGKSNEEVVREVPVEKIVEIEKVVTKIEYISDKTIENELLEKVGKLTDEMSKKDEELDELRRTLDELLDKPPIEVVKEVEVIKEVQNNEKSKMLENTLQNLRKELSSKNDRIIELEEINKQLESIKVNTGALYLKDSNLTQRM